MRFCSPNRTNIMAGARGQPERQIAWDAGVTGSAIMLSLFAKAAEGRPHPASAVHRLPTSSGRPQLPQSSPTSPRLKSGKTGVRES